MDSQPPIKTGYLTSSAGRGENNTRQDWQKRYYVLYAHSQTNKARLDWFNDENAFLTSPLIRKTIFVEEIKKVKATSIDGKQHGFMIETLRRDEPFLFSTPHKKDMKTWVDELNKRLEERKRQKPLKNPQGGDSHLGDGVYGNELWSYDEQPEEFSVTVGETDSAQGCNLGKREHTLQIYSHSMVLKHGKTGETLYVWPYKYIRRYGRSRSSFTFEAGRRCASGEGVFIMYSNQSEEIFNEVQKGNSQGSNTMTNPDLPSRSYGEHYGVMVQNNKQPDTLSQTSLDRSSNPYTRDRSHSSSSLEKPPVPTTARPTARHMQPLPGTVPIAQTYVEPPMVRNYEDTDTYSSIEEDSGPRGVFSDEGYAAPISEDNSSMSAISRQIRSKKNQVEVGEQAYDEVHLNVMKLPSTPKMDGMPPVYGQLYDQMAAPRATGTKPKQDTCDDYDEVRTP